MRVVALLLFVGLLEARRIKRLFTKSNLDAAPSNVQTIWYRGMKLDHFTYSDTRNFDLRIMINTTFYQPGGPIFFYTGNEGSLESFVTATGMMFDIAPIFHATIIFAEHRFYGQTQPFKKDSYNNIQNMGYLTSEQALADFAEVLTEFKKPNNQFNISYPADAPVISFGGSYGGMLSAWFRKKYPHIVTGAWAGSAPLIYFHDGPVDAGAFDSITTRTYIDNGCNRYILQNFWQAVLNLSSTTDGLAWLNNNTYFKLDPKTPIRNQTDGWNLNSYFREAIEYMAMVDYPYPTGFLEPLPAWPVSVACGFMNATGNSFTDQQLVAAVAQASNVYYNYNNNTNFTYCIDFSICGDTGTGGLGDDALGWPWQECSEIVMYMCSRGGSNDFFWNECGTDVLQLLQEQCAGIFAQYNWSTNVWNVDAIKTLYGLTLDGASNLILTQGHLDPWSGGGFAENATDVSRGIYVMEIPASAHHLDLRQPNTCDPNTVTNARYQIIKILKCWVDPTCIGNPEIKPLPSVSIPNGPCKDVVQGYPWGISESNASAVSTLLILAFMSFFNL
ncbi:unnamed protein product [Caenorhabditis bovis]|uniref:Uncharacterized protein n=1 Tax=Caenorhabditis bovis TaxID=2654633 RepID=A0A8S1EME7_9PELO|nr:unnamed protein product [Caenorhabditis bovis]